MTRPFWLAAPTPVSELVHSMSPVTVPVTPCTGPGAVTVAEAERDALAVLVAGQEVKPAVAVEVARAGAEGPSPRNIN